MSGICFKTFQEKDHCVWSRVRIREMRLGRMLIITEARWGICDSLYCFCPLSKIFGLFNNVFLFLCFVCFSRLSRPSKWSGWEKWDRLGCLDHSSYVQQISKGKPDDDVSLIAGWGGKTDPRGKRTYPRKAQDPYLPRLPSLFHAVEHGAQLCQPLSVHGSHTLHVLLRQKGHQARVTDRPLLWAVPPRVAP